MKPGIWMISKKRWAVTAGETTFDPANPQGVLGYIIQDDEGRWGIEGDLTCRRHDQAQNAVEDLMRSRAADLR